MASSELGSLRSSKSRPRLKLQGGAIPPHPRESVVLQVVPYPPTVSQTDGPEETWRLAALAYRAAIFEHKGERVPILVANRPRPALKTLLFNALQVLREGNVAPHTWCHFALATWWYHDKTRKRPSLNQVFSTTTIRKRRGWCRSEKAKHGVGGRLLTGPCYKDLLTRYQTLQEALQGASDIEAVVEAHLPPKTYKMLVGLATQESLDLLAEVEARRDNGYWIWD